MEGTPEKLHDKQKYRDGSLFWDLGFVMIAEEQECKATVWWIACGVLGKAGLYF